MENLKENPLIAAIVANNLEKVKELYKSGLDINALDTSDFVGKDGETVARSTHWSPIDLAISLKREEITMYLMKKGAKTGTSIKNARQ